MAGTERFRMIFVREDWLCLQLIQQMLPDIYDGADLFSVWSVRHFQHGIWTNPSAAFFIQPRAEYVNFY